MERRKYSSFRQTFIPFLPIPRSQGSQLSLNHYSEPKPAPELPVELWSLIFESSKSTLVLKSFRLVCQSWARLAAPWLFNTVYVDNFQQSWNRLQQLAVSPYAHHVQAMQFNLLTLPYEPLDGPPWRDIYPNLSSNMSALDGTRLHRAYRRCVRSARSFEPDDGMPNVEFTQLPNLRYLSIEDGVDLESRCSDPALRTQVHLATPMHESVAMWGHYPRMWIEGRELSIYHGYYGLKRLFPLLQNCSMLADCTINMWRQYWHWLVGDTRAPELFFRHPNIQNIRLIFKFCDEFDQQTSHRDSFGRIEVQMHKAFQSLGKFPQLRSLSIEPRSTHPGPLFSKIFGPSEAYLDDDELSRNCVNCTEDCECCVPQMLLSYINSRGFQPPPGLGGTRGVSSLQAVFHLGFAAHRNIMVLTLQDLSLNAKTLIAWLCSRYDCKSQSCDLTIILKGYIVIHGLNPSLFLDLMACFAVKIEYDATIIYYNMNNDYDLNGAIDGFYVKTRFLFWYRDIYFDWNHHLDITPGLNADLIYDRVYENTPVPMPLSISREVPSVQFTHYPQWIEEEFRRGWPRGEDFHYCMKLMPQSIEFYWTAENKEQLRQQNSHVLLLAENHQHQHAAYHVD